MKKNILSVLLVFALVLASFVPAGLSADEVYGATTFKDINGHWAKSYIEKAVKYGFVNGYPDGTFLPEKAVSRAEFIKMINSAIGNTGKASINFKDVPANEWFYSDICKAVSAAYVSGYTDGTFLPNASISRQEAAVIISRIVPAANKSSNLRSFKDYSSVSDWATDSLSRVNAKGYMGAYSDGLLHPTDKLTRAQTAKIICDILDKETIITSNTTIKSDSTKLSGKIYANNVTISKELENGDAAISNCVILGSLIIQGGGSDSIIIEDSRIAQSSVEKAASEVSVKLKGDTVIANMTAAKKAQITAAVSSASSYGIVQRLNIASSAEVSISGYFPEVNINGSSADLDIASGSLVAALNVNSKGSEITVNKRASITTATANAQCDFIGEGTIGNLVANSNNITYENKPNKITTGSGIKNPDISDSDLSITFSPKNGAKGVDVDTDIKITFSNPVTKYNGIALTSSNLTSLISLRENKASGSEVDFKASINAKKTVVTITPKNSLDEDTKYYIIIDKNSFKDDQGNGNSAESIYFTTDDEGGGDMVFTPKNGATGVKVDVEPTIKFSTSITDYDGDKITSSYLKNKLVFKKGSSSGTNVAFTAEYSKTTKTITITPNSDLTKNQKYYLAVPNKTFRDSDGDAIASKSITFTVGKSASSGPELENISDTSTENTITVKATATEAGTIYGVILKDGAKAPTARYIIAGKDGKGTALNSKYKDYATVKSGKTGTLEFTGLEKGVSYVCYLVLETSSETSDVYSNDIKTTKPTAYLSTLTVSGSKSFSPSFSQKTTDYEVTVPYGSTEATISASAASGTKIYFKVGTEERSSSENKTTIDLNSSGTTTVSVIARADDKASTEYKLKIKVEGNTGVSQVIINGEEVEYFSKAKAYCLTVDNEVTSADIKVYADDSNAFVKINGKSGNTSTVSNLKTGENGNTITFTITSNNDTASYDIVIVRKDPPAPTPVDPVTNPDNPSGGDTENQSSSEAGGNSGNI